jgi:flagellar basal-body rod protein FlgB
MAISFDKALGNLPEHLSLYGQRSSLLASNIANADTPGFKARDIDFQSLLSKASGAGMTMSTTQAGHIGGANAPGGGMELLYRVPTQTSLDGNTVNTQVEQAQFTENAVRYQSTLTFLGGKFSGLKLAITGKS